MSLLWPERLTIGLFPGQSWIVRDAVVTQHGAEDLLVALEGMLSAQAKPLRRGTRVQLMISDSVAFVMPLAWQELLTSPDELRTYARAAFEQRGAPVDEGWIVQTGFRHFRSLGIAYAVRRQWIEQVLELLAAKGLKLSSVLPVSAAAYWRLAGAAQAKQIVLLREPARLTAIAGQGARFLDLDVQPVAGSFEQAATRLLKRVAVAQGDVQQVSIWHAEPESSVSLDSIISACLPDAATARLPLCAWR
ncbi:hypothetical protein [Pseudoduganella sp. R-43]|uniref:hypothetical protein n=1 Tax=unclassified Pseudoduganella TaxID=2637179 RepID=UPI003CF87D29